MNILCVCHGNVARSQLLEAILTKVSTHFGLNWNIRSVGTDTTNKDRYNGKPIKEVIEIINEYLDLDWRATYIDGITQSAIDDADIIFVLTDKDWPDALKDSDKVIFWDIRDPHAGTIDEIDSSIREKLITTLYGISDRVKLLFPQDNQHYYLGILLALRDLTFGTNLSTDGEVKLPQEIVDAPPSGFGYEDLNTYKHKQSLMLLLSRCPLNLILEFIGDDAVELIDTIYRTRMHKQIKSTQDCEILLNALIEQIKIDPTLSRQGRPTYLNTKIRYSQIEFEYKGKRYMALIEDTENSSKLNIKPPVLVLYELNENPIFDEVVDLWTDERLVGTRIGAIYANHPLYEHVLEEVIRQIPSIWDTLDGIPESDMTGWKAIHGHKDRSANHW